MKIFIGIFVLLAGSMFAQTASQKHPFRFEEMMKLKRVGAPVPSPDGKWVVFDCEDVDLAANTKISHLWIVPASGGESHRLNPTPNHEERPRFSPDGKRLIWTSKATDPTQVWMCDFDPEAGQLVGKPHQVTSISTGADGAIWSPDGKNIVFVSAVYPDCNPPPPGSGVTSDDCNKKRDEELKKSKVKAKIFTRLFYRHWNAFTEFKRSHLFVLSGDARADRSTDILSVRQAGVSPAESQTPGETPGVPTGKMPVPRDLTPGDHDVPPFSLGGQDMYAISPDGQEVAYTSNIDEVEATSTNNEIFIVPISGGAPKKISSSPGADTTPLYSPDGKYIAWRSQARAGFEADKWRFLVQDRQTGNTREVAQSFEYSIGSFSWASRTGEIVFTAERRGTSPLFSTSVGANWTTIAENDGLHADDLTINNGILYFTRMSIQAPNEIWRLDLSTGHDANPTAVTHMNDALLSQIDMQPLESFTFKGANNDDVQGFLIKPPGFDPNKRYPLKFLLHGGPQGAWGNSWTYRWNAELLAATANYVVVMINFHGSTGYGQKFTDSISGDWGGKPYIDVMKGLDYVEKTFPFIDKNREAALGASYGGYMANWLLGHTNRFKCIVSHDGMFNAESAYGTTEELWFANWEFGGPPWKKRDVYRKWSPHEYAANFKTPTLVVHGQNDYRLDVSQGFDLFTTLQVLKVPSKMLYFPDEGHWVLKPQNSQLWYKTVNDWVDQWCK
ncbi:MAG TPA: S9 family peptidase [Candidatus Udaeobacter sp.]|nr:MAG: S9 family peptidase [Verrucomicrobiota bacterium]HMC24679.1 S9 family peptidase [Candidatus Udaeobacter sp.]